MKVEASAITVEDLLAHGAWLQRLAVRLCDASGADDLVQETWATALRAPPERDRPLRPWLAQVLRNLVRNRARTRARWAARARKIAAADDAPLPTPEALLECHEAQRLVADLVSGLDEPYRSTVLLCYGQGVSPAEVAARQEIPAGTVRWRLKRGLDDLRAQLDARFGGDRKAWALVLAPLLARAAVVAPAVGVPWVVAKFVVGAAAVAAVGVWVAPSVVARVTSARSSDVAAVEPPARAGTKPFVVENAAAPTLDNPARAVAANGGSTPTPSRGAVAAVAGAVGGQTGSQSAAPALSKEEAIRRAMIPGDAPMRGDPKAPVTMVVFTDFQCPFCARALPTINEVLGTYPAQVRLVFKNLPLRFHENAALAAEAALAAGEQGKFWQMHDRLFANQDSLDVISLEGHAKALELDVPKFKKALMSQKFRAKVAADEALAAAAGLNGTPAFLINGRTLMGAQPLSAFKTEIDAALATARGEPPPAARPTATPPAAASPEALRRAAAVGSAPTRGDAKAPVTIVEYLDFECPYSARAHTVLKELLVKRARDVRLVVRNQPLPFHADAALAAEAALAANAQGKFWEMHDRLFANQKALDRASLDAHAAALNLDVAKFKAALDAHTFAPVVAADREAASGAGINITPTFLVNGSVVSGAQSPEAFNKIVDWALDKAAGKPVGDRPPLPGPAANGVPNGVRVVPNMAVGVWPPPKVSLPDELLGERVPFALPLGDAPTLGSASAPVTIVYFDNLVPGVCARGKSIVAGLRQTYGDSLRIVARPVPTPTLPMPPATTVKLNTKSAEMAWAAHARGKYWELHDATCSGARLVDPAAMLKSYELAGINVDDLKADADAGTYREQAEADAEVFTAAKFSTLPTFVVNGRHAEGPVALVHLIEAALRKAGRPVPPWPTPSPAGPPELWLTLPQQFYSEPRNEAWAAHVEGEMARVVASDLKRVEGATNVRLLCKTTTCQVRWKPGKDGGRAGGAFMQAAYPMRSNGMNVKGEFAHTFSLQPSIGGPPPTAESAVKSWKGRRASILFNLRSGRQEPLAAVPMDRLPVD